MTKNQIIGAASSVFLIPSFVLTVIPTWATDPGSAVCIALGVIGLPFIPFALRRCDPGNRSILILLGGLLLLYNFSNALDALNGSHAVATGTARNRMTAAKALNEKISELDVRKGQIGPHKIVSEDAAASAQRARDDECHSGQGPVCRSLTASLATIKQDRASTKLDEDFDKAKADLAALGAVEKTADQTASQLASIAGLFWTPAASSGEAISTHRPIFRAFIVELMNGLMPWVLVTVFGTAVVSAKPKRRSRKGELPSKDSVLAWHKARIVRREGRSVRAGVAFADYQTWCSDNGIAPVNQKIFGETMKGELDVKKSKSESGTRTSYADIELRSPNLKLLQDPCTTAAKPLGRTGKRGRIEATA